MRKLRTAVLAGAAACLAAGAAVAASENSHVMHVNLPDGSVARIEYQGDVAPKVAVQPVTSFVPVMHMTPVALFDPFDADPFMASPFAMLDRVAAQMDRQAAAMMQQVRAMQAATPAFADGKVNMAAFKDMPAGTVSYSFVSSSTGNGTCSRSVQVTSYGPDEQPKVVSSNSGDCSAMAQQPLLTSGKVTAPGPAPLKVSAPAPARRPVPTTTI